MSDSFVIPAGEYAVEIEPAAQVRGTITDFGDGPYEISLNYYNQTVVFSTRPTVSDGTIGEQPGFS